MFFINVLVIPAVIKKKQTKFAKIISSINEFSQIGKYFVFASISEISGKHRIKPNGVPQIFFLFYLNSFKLRKLIISLVTCSGF